MHTVVKLLFSAITLDFCVSKLNELRSDKTNNSEDECQSRKMLQPHRPRTFITSINVYVGGGGGGLEDNINITCSPRSLSYRRQRVESDVTSGGRGRHIGDAVPRWEAVRRGVRGEPAGRSCPAVGGTTAEWRPFTSRGLLHSRHSPR